MGEAIGIGFAIAKALLADGWKLVLADLAQVHSMRRCARLDASRTNATNHGPGLLRATGPSRPVREGAILVEPPDVTRRDRRCRRVPARRRDAAIPGNFFGADGAAPASAGYQQNREQNRTTTKQEQQNLVLTIWNICI
jgi:NAD(P)-dependent dehydrogenase (short-subunit alcohol dehydrogenase family)